MKKRFLSVTAALVLLVVSLVGLLACGSRTEILRIYNWEDYLADGTIAKFVQQYREWTGKRIKVQTSGFSTNEQMYTQIATKQADYDLIVPSDYMVDHMRKENLLLPLDRDIVYNIDDKDDFVFEKSKSLQVYDQSILQIIEDSFDPQMKYSIPYLWGTVGILYDTVRGAELKDDAKSWNAIFGDKYAGKIYMQDSVVDAYAVGSIWANRDKLNAAKDTGSSQNLISEIINDTSSDNITRVRQVLANQRPNLLAYATDDANDRMATASIDDNLTGLLAMVWSVQAGYAMEDNTNLRYVVPSEGSNTWIDNFAIPVHAKNPTAANYFLRFLLQKDIAYANMEYIGATTAVEEARQRYETELKEELDDMKQGDYSPQEIDFLDNYIALMFPPPKIMDRVAAYQDWGAAKQDINMMWIQIKAGSGTDDHFAGGVWIMLGLLVVCVGGIVAGKSIRKKLKF